LFTHVSKKKKLFSWNILYDTSAGARVHGMARLMAIPRFTKVSTSFTVQGMFGPFHESKL
jgi:hypothetical protein